jgi:hypothetical protein
VNAYVNRDYREVRGSEKQQINKTDQANETQILDTQLRRHHQLQSNHLPRLSGHKTYRHNTSPACNHYFHPAHTITLRTLIRPVNSTVTISVNAEHHLKTSTQKTSHPSKALSIHSIILYTALPLRHFNASDDDDDDIQKSNHGNHISSFIQTPTRSGAMICTAQLGSFSQKEVMHLDAGCRAIMQCQCQCQKTKRFALLQ